MCVEFWNLAYHHSTHHISGNRLCRPFQLYTFSTASQNLPQDGMAAAPPENTRKGVKLSVVMWLKIKTEFSTDSLEKSSHCKWWSLQKVIFLKKYCLYVMSIKVLFVKRVLFQGTGTLYTTSRTYDVPFHSKTTPCIRLYKTTWLWAWQWCSQGGPGGCALPPIHFYFMFNLNLKCKNLSTFMFLAPPPPPRPPPQAKKHVWQDELN